MRSFLPVRKREGISLFETIPFDIVLCGDRLPDGNGLEMLREWMSQNPKLISILMTVHGDERLKQEAMQAGIQGYLEKPFDLKQLEEAISYFGLRIAESGMKRKAVGAELRKRLCALRYRKEVKKI